MKGLLFVFNMPYRCQQEILVREKQQTYCGISSNEIQGFSWRSRADEDRI